MRLITTMQPARRAPRSLSLGWLGIRVMPLLIIASIIWLTLIPSMRADSVELPVTPANLNTYDYAFSVSTHATHDGVAFHVTITNKQYDIYPDSSANVDLVVHKKLADGNMEGSVGPMAPMIPAAIKKAKRFWAADFTVAHSLVEDANACFVFSVLAHRTINGKLISMPSVTFYEFRLKDFARP